MNALELKEKRKNLGYTQAELAKKLGVSTKTIVNYENGEVIPITKIELLHNILSNNSLEESKEIYQKELPCKKELEQVKDQLKMAKRVIELLEDKSKILEKQVSLLENDIKNGKTD